MKPNALKKYKDKRPNLVTVSLSDKELAAIDEYCKMTKAPSRAAVIREGAVRFAMNYLVEERSKLFTDDYFDSPNENEKDGTEGQTKRASNRPIDIDLMGSLFGDDNLIPTDNTQESAT